MPIPTPRDPVAQGREVDMRLTLLERRLSSLGGTTPPTPNLPTYAIANGSGSIIPSGSPIGPPLTLRESSGITLIDSELVLPVNGIYIIMAAARYATNANGVRELQVSYSDELGEGIVAADARPALAGQGVSASVAHMQFCEAGSKISLSLYQDSGSGLEGVSYSLRVVLS